MLIFSVNTLIEEKKFKFPNLMNLELAYYVKMFLASRGFALITNWKVHRHYSELYLFTSVGM